MISKYIKAIFELTQKIKEEYPELYPYLDENPITIPSGKSPKLGERVFRDYLESLKSLLSHHIETHKKKIKPI